MRIEFTYGADGCTLAAVANVNGRSSVVACANAPKIDEAVKALVSQFADMQKETIEALNASGIVHYVTSEESESMS